MSISKNFLFNKRGARGFTGAPPVIAAGSANLVSLVARWFGQFSRRPATGGILEHLTTLPLTSQSALVLVRLGDETLLLGATAQNINLLVRNPTPAVGAGASDNVLTRQESL